MATTFPTFEEWARLNNYATRYDSETGNESWSPFARSKYWGERFNVAPNVGSGYGLNTGLQNLGSYEELLRSLSTGGNLGLPVLNLSDERINQILQGASTGGLSGMSSTFDSQLTPEELNAVTQYRNYESPDDFFTKWGPALGSLAFGGLVGATGGFGGMGSGAVSGGIEGLASSQGFLPGSFELGSSLYGGTAASGLNAAAAEWLAASGLGTSGGGMGFFDDILGGLASDEGFLPGSFDLGESLYGGTAAEGLDYAAAENWLRNLAGSGVSSLGNSFGRLLFGGNQTGGSGSGLLGFLGGGLGSAINTAPILAAINYARNQDPFDTSRLQSLYSNFDPSANAFQYDTNTGLGREELTSGLARRGISGSSFGDQSLTNYNTFRDLGRQSLLNQGIGTQAGIAGQILNADVAERQMKNDLYGRALLALSGGLAPRTSGALFA